MPTHRQELLQLVTDGTPIVQIVRHFTVNRQLSANTTNDLFRRAGLMHDAHHYTDGISDERRRQLQELSLT